MADAVTNQQDTISQSQKMFQKLCFQMDMGPLMPLSEPRKANQPNE